MKCIVQQLPIKHISFYRFLLKTNLNVSVLFISEGMNAYPPPAVKQACNQLPDIIIDETLNG